MTLDIIKARLLTLQGLISRKIHQESLQLVKLYLKLFPFVTFDQPLLLTLLQQTMCQGHEAFEKCCITLISLSTEDLHIDYTK
jgi:hypothetical protein